MAEPELGKCYQRAWKSNPDRPVRKRWVRKIDEHTIWTVSGAPGTTGWSGHREPVLPEQFRRLFVESDTP